MWTKISDDKLMEFLTCIASPNIIHNYLNLENTYAYMCIICKLPSKQIKDHIIRFFLIVAKHARNKITFNYIIKNFEKIKPR